MKILIMKTFSNLLGKAKRLDGHIAIAIIVDTERVNPEFAWIFEIKWIKNNNKKNFSPGTSGTDTTNPNNGKLNTNPTNRWRTWDMKIWIIKSVDRIYEN
jgi:hypothetical protein